MEQRTKGQDLPDALVDVLDGLNAPALRSVRVHVEQRLDELRPTLREMVRSEADCEIVDIIDDRPYTLVRKYRSPGGSSDAAPRTLSLYRVKRETQLDGEVTLNWSYLGDVAEPVSVECRNCGNPLEDATAACPRCGETHSRDEEG
jgi:hypothetical protein